MDLETTENTAVVGQKQRKHRDLGPLHALLIRGLPDWVDETGLFLIYDLAKHLKMSAQGIYGWLDRGKVPPKRVFELVELSESSKNQGEDFKPLTHTDFAGFL